MSQISILKTDTPETPVAGRAAIYVNLADVPFLKKSDGTSVSFVGAPQFKAAEIRENNTVLFNQNYITGNGAARTGNIDFDFTGAELGAWTEMRHADPLAFTFPATAKLMFDVADISTTVDNFFLFVLTNKTASSEVVKVFHAKEGGI